MSRRAAYADERARRASVERRALERSRRRLARRMYLTHHPHRTYWQVAVLVIVLVPVAAVVVMALQS